METNPVWLWKNEYIGANHNLYCNNELFLARNIGYTYNATQETEEKYSDIMQVKNNIKVYDGAAINYDEISSLSQGDIVKRIKKEVNHWDNHTWDKVVLNNGIEGYVYSEELEKTKQYTKLDFQYNNQIYNIYFNPSKYGVENIEDYPYYFVAKENNEIIICYSKQKITVRMVNQRRDNYGSSTALKLVIGKNGSMSGQIINMATNPVWMWTNNYMTANHDIFCGNTKVISACVYVDNGKLGFTTDSSWDNIKIRENAYDDIVKGEEEYNSMSNLEHNEFDEYLEKQRAEYLLACVVFKNSYPNAARALAYYLTKGEMGETEDTYVYEEGIYEEGHTKRRISLLEAIDNNNSIKDKIRKNIENVLNVAEILNVDENVPVTFYNMIEDTGKTKKEEGDWHLALGQYRIKIQSTVTRRENDYKLDMRYQIIDYYNWNPEKSGEHAAIIGLEECLELMHKAGIARNYTNYGEVFYTITWNKTSRATNGEYEIRNNF